MESNKIGHTIRYLNWYKRIDSLDTVVPTITSNSNIKKSSFSPHGAFSLHVSYCSHNTECFPKQDGLFLQWRRSVFSLRCELNF